MPDSTVHKTNIFGQEYIMKSSADAALMSKISNYVNQKMDELEESGLNPNSEQLKIAVHACMNIAYELFLEKNKKNEIIRGIEAKGDAFIEFIDDRIKNIKTRK